MFRGNCPTRLDEKGRLKIPADFKHEIDRKYDGQFYLTSYDGKVIKLFPLAEWELVEENASRAESYEAREKFFEITSYYGQQAGLDAQGRLTIAEWLRNKFGLKGEMSVLGKGTHLELRVAEEVRKSVEENPPTLAELDVVTRPRS